MSKIRITKQFHFEMAHALWNYDGPCRNVHGHSYILFVTFSGEPVNDPQSAKNGMLVDFGDLKKLVYENVIRKLDHSLMIAGFAPEDVIQSYKMHFENIIISPYQPTCENIVNDIASTLMTKAPAGLALHSVRLHETATSYAEWYASDNL